MKTETKLKPDFSHRLSELENNISSRTLSNAIMAMTYQAESTINILTDQFVDLPDDDKGGRASDETIYWTLESVMQTIRDIRATVNAYHEANRQAAGESA